MGTNRGDELIHQIAAAIDIDKMRKGKASSMDGLGEKFGVVCSKLFFNSFTLTILSTCIRLWHGVM